MPRMKVSRERKPEMTGMAPSTKSTNLTTARASSATMANWYMHTSWVFAGHLGLHPVRPRIVTKGDTTSSHMKLLSGVKRLNELLEIAKDLPGNVAFEAADDLPFRLSFACRA